MRQKGDGMEREIKKKAPLLDGRGRLLENVMGEVVCQADAVYL